MLRVGHKKQVHHPPVLRTATRGTRLHKPRRKLQLLKAVWQERGRVKKSAVPVYVRLGKRKRAHRLVPFQPLKAGAYKTVARHRKLVRQFVPTSQVPQKKKYHPIPCLVRSSGRTTQKSAGE